ncbi:MAG TPA: ABC transporter ATP-binding protein [Candidatus Tectomicrobia bacterium]|nr:ABC transporter ATP-binding protein [Candidatus Tectomicrobia bacterium]
MTPSPHPEDEVLGRVYDHRLIRRLLGYVRPYTFHFVLAAALMILWSAAQLAGPYLIKVAIDRYILLHDRAGLGLLTGLYVFTLLAASGVRGVQIYTLSYMSQRVMFDLRMQLFSHLQTLSPAFYDRNPLGRVMSRLTSDIDALNEMLTYGLIGVLADALTLVGIVVILLHLHLPLALLTLLVLPLLIGTFLAFRGPMREVYRDIRIKLARVNATLQENLSGMRVVQLLCREPRNFVHFQRINGEHMAAQLRSIWYQALFTPAVGIITSLGIALILWRGGGWAVEGTLTVGTLAAFLSYVQRFFQPIENFSDQYTLMQSAMAAAERVFQLLDQRPEIRDSANPAPAPAFHRAVEFRHVSFGYGRGDQVLHDVSFTLRKGERLALIGPTGAGKTSIVSLLCRFYEPQQGRILLDGVDIRQLPLADLRGKIGLVLQDPFLFSASLEHNLTLGNAAITRETLAEAARLIGTDRLMASLPEGLETPILERGANLSVGQKQLLSLTRALAHDPEILILDEATSSVDGEAEAMIQEGIRKLLAHRTALVIAHRLSTIREMDRILVLDHGRLVEQGTHDQLLAAGGLYAKLYGLQFTADAAYTHPSPERIGASGNPPPRSSSDTPSLAPRR